jgi:hypothetical protein
MIFGMSLATFTMVHVVISLIGIVTGLIVLGGLLAGHRMSIMTVIFLVTTLATTVGGFLFPFNGFTPAIGTGIVSLIILAVTLVARYVRRLSGSWRWIYAAGAVASLYLNFFVAVVQSFQKIPAFNVYAPTGTEGPFAITQGIVLLCFILLGVAAVRRFHPLVD